RRRRHRGHVGHRWDLSEGVRHRARRGGREEWPGLQTNHREAGRRLLVARGGSGGDNADAGARSEGRGQGVRAVGVILAVGAALALQTTLARFLVRGTAAVDLVLVAVVYVALTSGPVTGLLS